MLKQELENVNKANSPLMFNNYQALTNATEGNVNTSKDETNSDVQVNIDSEKDKLAILRRRDLLLFCLQFKRWSKDEIVNALNRKCQSSPLDIKSDLHALKISQNFHLHDRRLKNAINIALDKRKSNLRIQGKQAIFHAMEQTTRFDSDLLVSISLQYQYNPNQIVSEIVQHKKFSTQLMLHKQLNVKRPFVKALFKCAKLNLYY